MNVRGGEAKKEDAGRFTRYKVQKSPVKEEELMTIFVT